MDKYLNEADAKRYLELLSMGVSDRHMETDEYKELCALMDKSLAKQIEIYGKPQHTPFEGKCRRCGRKFDNPVPEITFPEGINEIACSEWCAECNQFAVSVLFRWSSAYRMRHPVDPVRGGSRNAGT